MKLKKINGRILEIRNDGWFWDSNISPELARSILSLKIGEEKELTVKNVTLSVERERGRKFFVELQESDKNFGALYSRFALWQDDLEKVAGSPKRKPAKETLRTAVNAPLCPKFRSSIRVFKKALRRAKKRSCFLGGFEYIGGVTSLSAERFLRQQGFRISPEGELLHPRGRRNTFEKLNEYKSDKLLEEFGLL